jgi:NAD(P)H-dependent flavin oxidoreductase YrpB (nitropropane dioxygenase family)
MAFAGLTPDLAIAVSEAGGIGAIGADGAGVGLVNDIRPAGEVVERMMNEAQTILGRLGRSLS